MPCELLDGTNGSNTKETFLSVLVLRKEFLSGNQPLVSQESRRDMRDFVSLNPAHEYNVASLKPPQDFSWLYLRNSEVEFEDYFESEVDFEVDFGMIGNGEIH